jgi:phosphoribosylformylglycinamidine synthase PurS subunit
MKFRASIDIMPHKELLDPQGKTVLRNLKYIDIEDVEDVRIGKHIEILLEAESADEATKRVEHACEKLLANLITETYSYRLDELD